MNNKIYHNKEWLENQIINFNKNAAIIGRELSVDKGTISKWIKKYNIKSKYKNKDWLYKQYIKLKKNTTEIGSICGVAHTTIGRWLRKLNIPARSVCKSNNMKYKKKEWLYRQYKILNKNMEQIAEECNVSYPTIYYYIKKYNMLDLKRIDNKPLKWKGGKKEMGGYICLYKPNHPRAHQKYIKEHIIIMEKHIGRFMNEDERVHHINGIKNDNRIENLYLCKNRSKHQTIHRQLGRIALEIYKNKKAYNIGFNKEKGIYYIY